jgi:hypothetical protein
MRGRDEQARPADPTAAQLARELECDERAHAVTEQSVWPCEPRRQHVGQRRGERPHTLEWPFEPPRLPTWELHRTDLDRRRQLTRPRTERGRSTTRVR